MCTCSGHAMAARSMNASAVPQEPVTCLVSWSVVRLSSLVVRRSVCLYVTCVRDLRLLSVLSSGTSAACSSRVGRCPSRCCSGRRRDRRWTRPEQPHAFGSLFAVLYGSLCVVCLRLSVLFALLTCLTVVCPLVRLSVRCECWPADGRSRFVMGGFRPPKRDL